MLRTVLITSVATLLLIADEITPGVPPYGSSDTNKCVLPDHPQNGIYKVANAKNANPGQTLESFLLTVFCRRGYGLVSSDNETEVTDNQVICVKGFWQQNMPKCVRYCKLEPDASIRYMCHIPEVGYKACPTYVPPGTVATPVCNALYQPAQDLDYMTCTRGYWDYLPHCKPDCGLITPEGEQLVIGGELAKRGELPWHVGIYRKTTDSHDQICGGSIISNNVVLSAAHCFWRDTQKQQPASDFAVAAGKLYRSWDSTSDISWQHSDVKEIHIPVLFKGGATNFQEDIAALILVTPFVFTTYLRPVCLSYETSFDTYQLQPGKFGKVAGWGLTEESGQASPELKVVSMPYISTDVCIDALPPSFTEFITSDKFCAGYLNGTALCKGDSGGGLAFGEKEQGKYRYYLRGIVSTAPRSDSYAITCNRLTYTAFTKIRKHEEFIKRALKASVKKSCPLYMFQCADGSCVDGGSDCNGKQDCADGSDEADDLCVPETFIDDQSSCIIPEMPVFSWFRNEGANFSSPYPIPGQRFDSVVLKVGCTRNFYTIAPNGRMKYHDMVLKCVDGQWSDEIPQCTINCDRDPKVRYKCRHPQQPWLMPCNKYKQPDIVCSPNGDLQHNVPDPVIKCASNSSKPVVCNEDCGRLREPAKGQANNGGKKGKLIPWLVSIYEKSDKEYLFYCSGTLISNNVVISAADRFWDEKKGYIRLSEWGAAAGQRYRLWEDERNINAQKSSVSAITVPETYVGKNNGYKDDVAVIVLGEPFIMNAYVGHVCIDWDTDRDNQQLSQDNVGQVAGWSRVDKTGSLTPKLVNLTYIPFEDCDYRIPSHQYDQICARFANSSLQFLESNLGSGLVFASNHSGTERYYLRGILTTKCLRPNICFSNTLATFSRMTQLKSFIDYYTLPNW